MGRQNPLTEEEKETIKQMLLDGMSVMKISGLVGRSAASVQNIKKELGLVSKEKTAHRHVSSDFKELCQKWNWKNPRTTQKPKTRKRDFWAKSTNSNFRTPYHYPGKPLH